MYGKKLVYVLIPILLLLVAAKPGAPLMRQASPTVPIIPFTVDDILRVVNEKRNSNGLPSLHTNAILMSTAQLTANYMAANDMTGHIGGIAERIKAAGYGAQYPDVFATENFAIGGSSAEDVVLNKWNDDLHMRPMAYPYYCDVGVGIAMDSEGYVYTILHAAYISDVRCGKATATPKGPTHTPGPSPTIDMTLQAQQWIMPVITSTLRPDGKLVHEVRQGQSLWAIAVAYNTHINDIINMNGLDPTQVVVYVGEKLFIPTSLTPVPMATLTPTASAPALPSPSPEVEATGNSDSSPGMTASPIFMMAAVSNTPTRVPKPATTTDSVILGGMAALLVVAVISFGVGLIFRRPVS